MEPASAMQTRRAVLRRSLPFIAAALMLAGCAPKVAPTGELASYTGFDFVDRRDVKIRRGPDLEALKGLEHRAAETGTESGAATAPTAAADRPTTRLLVFVVEPVKWSAGDRYEGEDRESLQRTARESLLYWIGRNYPYPVIYRYGLLPNDPLLHKADVVFVDSTITDIRTGFAPMRFPLLAILNLGAVSIQLEGCLRRQSPSGPAIAEFAVRSRTNGGPEAGGSNSSAFFRGFFWGLGVYPKMYSNVYCLNFGSNVNGYKLLPHLSRLIPPPPQPETKEAKKQ